MVVVSCEKSRRSTFAFLGILRALEFRFALGPLVVLREVVHTVALTILVRAPFPSVLADLSCFTNELSLPLLRLLAGEVASTRLDPTVGVRLVLVAAAAIAAAAATAATRLLLVLAAGLVAGRINRLLSYGVAFGEGRRHQPSRVRCTHECTRRGGL